VAHMHAGGMPMAVPESCFQYVSENWNTLLCMMRARASMTWTGRSLSLWRAAPAGMLVYMLMASQIKNHAVGGKGFLPVVDRGR